MRDLVRRHETGAFVALAFGLSWPLWILSGVLGRADLRAPDGRWAVALYLVIVVVLAVAVPLVDRRLLRFTLAELEAGARHR